MDTSTPEKLIESHVADVAEMPLAQLLRSKDPHLIAAVKRLLASAPAKPEASLGWQSFLDQ